MTQLSVNINKIALIRNARPGNNPDILQFAAALEKWGCQGITVHPRPDERHIRYADLLTLKKQCQTPFNIEGNPTEKFVETVIDVMPDQVTLVPDTPQALTSDAGWDAIRNGEELKDILQTLNPHMTTSVFVDCDEKQVEAIAKCGADRVELYTGPYADGTITAERYAAVAQCALNAGLKINAGHDLNLDNLNSFLDIVPEVSEVSIGHAFVIDMMWYGIEETCRRYLAITGKER